VRIPGQEWIAVPEDWHQGSCPFAMELRSEAGVDRWVLEGEQVAYLLPADNS